MSINRLTLRQTDGLFTYAGSDLVIRQKPGVLGFKNLGQGANSSIFEVEGRPDLSLDIIALTPGSISDEQLIEEPGFSLGVTHGNGKLILQKPDCHIQEIGLDENLPSTIWIEPGDKVWLQAADDKPLTVFVLKQEGLPIVEA